MATVSSARVRESGGVARWIMRATLYSSKRRDAEVVGLGFGADGRGEGEFVEAEAVAGLPGIEHVGPAEDGLERDGGPRGRTRQHHAERDGGQRHGGHEEARAGVGEPGQREEERRRPQEASGARRRASSPMGSASKSGPKVPVRRSPKASSQGTCAGRTSPRERRDAASSCSVAMWKYGLGNTRFISGATGFPVSTAARTIHGAIIKRGAGRHDQDRLPAALRGHEEHRAGHDEEAGELDGVAESGERAGGQQVARVGEQQEIEGREQEEDARGVVVGGRSGDPGHGRAEIEDRGDERGQIGGAQAAADAEDQRQGGEEEGELHQLGGGVAAEGKGHGIEHLHALRHDVVEGDVVGKAAEAEVFVGQSEVVGDAVGDGLRGERVDQVPDAVGGEDDPCGAWNANGIVRARAAVGDGAAPRGEDGDGADGEEGAPVGQMEEQQEEDEDALGGGADGERRSPEARGAGA